MTAQESTHTGRPTIVEVSGVSKRFTIRKDNSLKERIVTLGRAGRRHREDFWALDGVDLTIEAGTTIGLIGHNGSGKSTLLKVIGGIIDPTLGSVSRRGRIAALLELGAGFHPDLTGRENVFLNASILGLSRDETEASFDSILEFSGIGNFIDTQVKFYSSGMYVRLAFAVAIHTDPDLLLVDEVLAVGDEAFQRKCLDKIREFQHEGRTIVLVSHSLGQVIEMCDRAVLLNQGKVVLDGDPREAVADFRDILEGRRIEGERSSGHEQKRAAARSTATRAFAVGREEGETIQPGDDLVIEIDFVSDVPLEGWLCGIQIDNELGQVAYSTSNKGHKLQLRPLVGERTVRLVLPHVALNGGKYFVNASLIDSAGQHLHDIPQATSFNVKDDGRATGILYSESELIELP